MPLFSQTPTYNLKAVLKETGIKADALRMWEPRIEVLSVNVSSEDAQTGILLAEILYQIKSTHDSRSIVYPFYIAQEQELR